MGYRFSRALQRFTARYRPRKVGTEPIVALLHAYAHRCFAFFCGVIADIAMAIGHFPGNRLACEASAKKYAEHKMAMQKMVPKICVQKVSLFQRGVSRSLIWVIPLFR